MPIFGLQYTEARLYTHVLFEQSQMYVFPSHLIMLVVTYKLNYRAILKHKTPDQTSNVDPKG